MPALLEIGDCPVHGTVEVIRVGSVRMPEKKTRALCLLCYIEFFDESVTKCENPRLAEVPTA